MLWIISGLTSAGKSTFIRSPRCAELTGLPSETPVYWPKTQSELVESGAQRALFHYNLLRVQFLNQRLKKQALRRGAPVPPPISGIANDPILDIFDSISLPKQAIVLVASRQTINARMVQRSTIEDPDLSGQAGGKPYQTEMWVAMLESIDIARLYADWCQTLRSHGIDYIFVASEDGYSYPVITEAEAFAILK